MEPISAVSTQMRDLALAIAPTETLSSETVRHLVHEFRQPLSVIESAAYLSQLILDRSEPRVHDQLEKIEAAVLQMSVMLSDLAIEQQPARHGEPLSFGHLVADAMRHASETDEALFHWASSPPIAIVRMPPAQATLLVRHALGVLAYLGGSRNAVAVALRLEDGITALECSVNLLVPVPSMPAEVNTSLAAVKRLAEANGGGARIESGDGCKVTLRVTLPAC